MVKDNGYAIQFFCIAEICFKEVKVFFSVFSDQNEQTNKQKQNSRKRFFFFVYLHSYDLYTIFFEVILFIMNKTKSIVISIKLIYNYLKKQKKNNNNTKC